MTPREEAVRLIDRYLDEVINETDINFPLELPKSLAIIAVNLAIEFADNSELSCYDYRNTLEYLEEVKKEIDKL